MTVKEMIDRLSEFPPDMRLVRCGEFGDFYDVPNPTAVQVRLDARHPSDRSPTHIDADTFPPGYVNPEFAHIPVSDAVAI